MNKRVLTITALGVAIVAAFWGFRRTPWNLNECARPWGDAPSIYSHIERNLEDGGVRLSSTGLTLPDEKADGGIKWAAGALDGVMGHHVGSGGEDFTDMLGALKELERVSSAAKLGALHAVTSRATTLSFIDELLDAIDADASIRRDRVRAIGLLLAREAPDRESVKFGIALLGRAGAMADEPLLFTLGKHDEFTLFVAVALANLTSGDERKLWQLARTVEGWGRVQTVERLAKTQDPAIKAWLLREGFRNRVMYEYLAYLAAETGELHIALAAEEIDEELFSGAGEILKALIDGQGGPDRGIDDYAHASVAIREYLRHAASQAKTLRHLSSVLGIQKFLERPDGWAERSGRGFTAEVRDRCLQAAREITRKEEWPSKIGEAIRAGDDEDFYDATSTADSLSLDVWDEIFARAKSGRVAWSTWFLLFRTKDLARHQRALTLAGELIPYEKISTGPAMSNGMGPGFAVHGNVETVVNALERFPGSGWPFVRAALSSPVIRNRNGALRTLAAWPRASWPQEGELVLRRALVAEPDEKVRAAIEAVLRGEQPFDKQ